MLLEEMEGLIVCILEADITTAIELDAIALHLGCREIFSFRHCSDAERWLAIFRPDLAIVDPSQEVGDCCQIFAMLETGKVPLVVV